MKEALKVMVLGLTLASVAGCSSLRLLENTEPQTIQGQVKPGDDVKIITRDGRTWNLEVEKVEADALTGEASSGKRYKVPYAAMRTVQVAEISGESSEASAVVPLVVIGVVAVVYLMGEMFEDFGDSLSEIFGGGDDQ